MIIVFIDPRFKGYQLRSLKKDILSGIIVGIIAIPLAMAFTIACGLNPKYGIYSTIVAGFIIALLGGSRFQISGPTGAFVPILMGIVMEYGYHQLLVIGILSGVILVLMGVFKIGQWVHYIPKPVIVGFTTGIAVLIFMGQIPSFLGLHPIQDHDHSLHGFKHFLIHIDHTHLYTILTAMICLSVILVIARWAPGIPGSLVGLMLSTLIAMRFYPTQVATIGSVFGSIPSQLPPFQLPDIASWNTLIHLFVPACIVAALGGMESLLSAVVADSMTKTQHQSNRELIAQGIGNMLSPLFGGIPATGGIARTATNIKNGAVSPISGMVHSLFVLVVLLTCSPYASLIPLASMAPILMVVAWNMSERKEFIHILKMKTGDSLVLITTFLLTLTCDLVIGVMTGLILSLLLFGIHMGKASTMVSNPLEEKDTCFHDDPRVHIYTLQGPIFFGSARKMLLPLHSHDSHHSILILRMNQVPYIDATGIHALSILIHTLAEKNRTLIIQCPQEQPQNALRHIHVLNPVAEHLFATEDAENIHHIVQQKQ